MKKLAMLASVAVLGFAAIAYAQRRDNGVLRMGGSDTPVRIGGEARFVGPVVGDNALGAVVFDGGVIVTGDLRVQNVRGVVAAPGDGGSPTPFMQYSQSVLSSGTLTITFPTAFSSTPTCVCSDTASTAAACSTNAVSSSQVTLKGGTSAVINWVCIGQK